MINWLKLLVISLSALIPLPLLAENTSVTNGANTANQKAQLKGGLDSTIFGNIANVLIFLVGALAVLVVIYGGIRYVTSTGDAARVKAAKDTILYGIVGIVVALLAYAIVTFVIGSLK
jgi:hypothetical protein